MPRVLKNIFPFTASDYVLRPAEELKVSDQAQEETPKREEEGPEKFLFPLLEEDEPELEPEEEEEEEQPREEEDPIAYARVQAKAILEDARREAEIQKATQDAAALKAEYEAKLRQAEEDIQAARVKHQQALDEEKNRQLAEAREQARGIIATASKTAELRSNKIIEDAREEIRVMAEDMVEKLVLQSGGDALNRFLDEAESGGSNG